MNRRLKALAHPGRSLILPFNERKPRAGAAPVFHVPSLPLVSLCPGPRLPIPAGGAGRASARRRELWVVVSLPPDFPAAPPPGSDPGGSSRGWLGLGLVAFVPVPRGASRAGLKSGAQHGFCQARRGAYLFQRWLLVLFYFISYLLCESVCLAMTRFFLPSLTAG